MTPLHEYWLDGIRAILYVALFATYLIKMRPWRRRNSLRSLLIEMTVLAVTIGQISALCRYSKTNY
jgi:hypothetical protein